MSKSYVSKPLRARIAEQAKHRCGYCLSAEHITGSPLEIDHIIPEASGGPTEEDNLWLARNQCNQRKSDRMWALDPASGEVVRLFDPRHQSWSKHFRWNGTGDLVEGLTPVGRATVDALQVNRPALVIARRRSPSLGRGWMASTDRYVIHAVSEWSEAPRSHVMKWPVPCWADSADTS